MNRPKTLYFHDGQNIKDYSSINILKHPKNEKRRGWGDTEIEIKIPGTGEVIWKGHNKVILPGAGFIARAIFDLPSYEEITPSYNTALGLENTVYETPDSNHKTFLFCVGTDGCGREMSQVYDVNYAKWCAPEDLVPFRYQLYTEDLDITLRDVYYGRKEIGDRIAYYFKAFETEPVFVQQYVDGTPIDSNVYESEKTEEIESYVELRLAVTKEDCRDYFIQTTGINDARINTISLCTTHFKYFESNGQQIQYPQDVRALTKLNFPSEPLIDLSKGLDIIYHVYF